MMELASSRGPSAQRTTPRPRSQIFPPSTPLDQSPSLSRSYRQPTGTGSLRKSQAARGHQRSYSQGAADTAGAFPATSASGGAATREVFCDVVVPHLEMDEDGTFIRPAGPISSFLNSLGQPVPAAASETSTRPGSRPSTPAAPSQPNPEKVRRSLHELWATEESYLRKITSLAEDYATPLRAFSKKRETAIIPAFEATHLFINIDQLVPIAKAFERDLRQIVARAQQDPSRVPAGFGEVILSHVETMTPYKKWLANVSASEAIRRELDRHNSSFREFIERTQIHSRETARSTGGFKEFLAEPFQRVSRYRLMIDPIVRHLDPEDPNVEPLQLASSLLSDICSMEVDGATQRAAMFWSLKETIDGFPDSLVDFDRRLLATIDADEVIDVTDSRPTTLRCTLFLFDDKLLITKRPSGDKQGKVHAGVDDLDRAVGLYQTSHLTSSQASILGSPKRLRKGVLGFRGVLDLAEVSAVDLGTQSDDEYFGLVFDRPPENQSERWAGRPARRFVVAPTHAADTRRAEKAAWLNAYVNAVLRSQLQAGAQQARRREAATGGELDGGRVRLNWSIWNADRYERVPRGRKGKLALLLTNDGTAAPLAKPSQDRPLVSVTATFIDSSRCRFEVYSTDSPGSTAEIIEDQRIATAVATISPSYGLYSFPTVRPLAPGSGRSRTRSNLLSVLDVFSSGAGLKRGNSLVSKGSSAATTTLDTPSLSRHDSRFESTPPKRPNLAKQSAPDLSRSAGPRPVGPGDLPTMTSSISHGSVRSSRTRGRRSMSLPPAPTEIRRSPTPPAVFADAPSPAGGAAQTSPDNCDTTMEVAESDQDHQPYDPIGTSPIGYRQPTSSPRRRMIGPRDMRAGQDSPEAHPFARNHTPPAPSRLPPTAEKPPSLETGDSETSLVYAKRPRAPAEPSPRPTPAKKMAAQHLSRMPGSLEHRGTQQLFPDRASHATTAASHRAPSAASSRTAREMTPPCHAPEPDVFSPAFASVTAPELVAPSLPANVTTAEGTDAEDAPRYFDRLKKHVDDMRLKLARELANANKENERILSPTALTRSPQTRNVFGKAIQAESVFPSPSVRSAKAAHGVTEAQDARSRHKIDFAALSDWTRRLADLIDACERATRAEQARPTQSPDEVAKMEHSDSVLEVAMLEQERDLIAAQLANLKAEMDQLRKTSRADESAAEAVRLENGKLRQAYADICSEADALHADFNAALESVHLAAQAEPSATGEYVELTSRLTEAVSARFDAEHQLRLFRRQVQAELDEKERWGRLLRKHGLLA